MKMQVKHKNFKILKFVGVAFISASYHFITSSHIIAKLSIILAKYFPFSQLDIARFQT